MQYGLLYLPINNHGLSVAAISNTGAIQSFFSCKLAEKLQVTVQPIILLILKLPLGKTLIATKAIELDMLIDDLIYK